MISIYIMNLILCAAIVGLGWWVYQKNKNNRIALFIAVAFGLFGFSHLAAIFDIEQHFPAAFIVIRTFGYIFVIAGLLREMKK